MKGFAIVIFLALPLFVRSQIGLIGKWIGHFPGKNLHYRGESNDTSALADSTIMIFVFEKNKTGYLKTRDYTDHSYNSTLQKFTYTINDFNHISMVFSRRVYNKIKFCLNNDTLYFVPTKKEAFSESIDLIYEMKYRRAD